MQCAWKLAGRECVYNHRPELVEDLDRVNADKLIALGHMTQDDAESEANRLRAIDAEKAAITVCKICNKVGHFARDCTEKPAKGKGKSGGARGNSRPPSRPPPGLALPPDPWQDYRSKATQ